jgi:hypothetical protein
VAAGATAATRLQQQPPTEIFFAKSLSSDFLLLVKDWHFHFRAAKLQNFLELSTKKRMNIFMFPEFYVLLHEITLRVKGKLAASRQKLKGSYAASRRS